MKKYTDLNQFLERFFAMNTDPQRTLSHDQRAIADALQSIDNQFYRIDQYGNADAYVIKNLQDNLLDRLETEQGHVIVNEIIDALSNPTPEAIDFLRMARGFTTFFASQPNQVSQGNAIELQLNVIGRGKVKNPDFAYYLLQKMVQRGTGKFPEGKFIMARRLLALNPKATLHDIYEYADHMTTSSNSDLYATAPEELIQMLNDQMTIMDQKIEAERAKDVPNTERIRALYPGALENIANRIREIMLKQRRPAEEIQAMSEIIALIKEKYDVTKLLDFEHPAYIQQFEDQASLKLAQAQSQLATATEKVTKLEARNAALEAELKAKDQELIATRAERDMITAQFAKFIKLMGVRMATIKTYLLKVLGTKRSLTRGAELAEAGEQFNEDMQMVDLEKQLKQAQEQVGHKDSMTNEELQQEIERQRLLELQARNGGRLSI